MRGSTLEVLPGVPGRPERPRLAYPLAVIAGWSYSDAQTLADKLKCPLLMLTSSDDAMAPFTSLCGFRTVGDTLDFGIRSSSLEA